MKRLGYRIGEIMDATGLSRDAVEGEVKRRGIRRKKIGGAVLLEAAGCEAAFGFADEPAPRPVETPRSEILARAAEMAR